MARGFMIIKLCAITAIISSLLSAINIIATEQTYPTWQISTAIWAILWIGKRNI